MTAKRKKAGRRLKAPKAKVAYVARNDGILVDGKPAKKKAKNRKSKSVVSVLVRTG